ncbi:DUF3710 domain-containing protein [Corynebacterium sp. p3-SID1145]|nr:DUF3710 domain-containing protein [Corynebacterium sp. p3-SID1145]MCT1452129.1 DUF3710 domain-containing protein [Corynebacterium sp. p3-SID1145]
MEEPVQIPDEIRVMAEEIVASLPSERDYGPLDSSQVGPDFFEELKYKPERPRDRRHAIDSLHVWTTSLAFYAPQGISVFEEVEEESTGDGDESASHEEWGDKRTDLVVGGGQKLTGSESQPDVLHVLVPDCFTGQEMWISLSVFAAPRTEKLWQSSGWEYSYLQLLADNVEINLRETPWGIGVSARYPNQQVEVIGVDGPRWVLRATVSTYGDILKDSGLKLAQDIVESAVVHRGVTAVGPGGCLPIGLIDRRNKPPRGAKA